MMFSITTISGTSPCGVCAGRSARGGGGAEGQGDA